MRKHAASQTIRHNRRPGWMKLAALGGLGVVSVLLAGLLFSWVSQKATPTRGSRLDMAMQHAQRGDFVGASNAAAGLDAAGIEDKQELSKFQLLKGMESFELSKSATLKQSQFTYLDRAVRDLEQSSKIGFPPGYEGLGSYYYGSTLFDLRRFQDAYPLLETAVQRFPKKRFEAIEKIVYIDTFHSKKFDRAKVEKQIDRWINFPVADTDDIDRANLALATLYKKTGESDAALKALKSISPESVLRPEADLMAAVVEADQLPRIRQPDGSMQLDDHSRPQLTELIQRLEVIADNVTATRQLRGRASYALSTALHELQRSDDALTYLSDMRTSLPQSIESLAAAVFAIRINADLKRWNDAIQTMKMLNKETGEVRWYENDWIPMPEIHQSLLKSGHQFLANKVNLLCVDYCDQLPKFIGDEDRLRIKAPALSIQADKQADDEDVQYRSPEKLVTQKEKVVDKNTLSLYQQAGRCYERLANLQLIAPDYPQFLSSAIRCYSLGKDYVRSNILIEQYLDIMPRNEQPPVLIQKAQNSFNQGNSAAALESLKRCITVIPDHPLTATARLYAAQILQNEYRYDEAVDQLLANLYDGNLTPESILWRVSLYDLGTILCKTGNESLLSARSQYDTAIGDQRKQLFAQMNAAYDKLLQGSQRLEEAIRRYPNDERNFECLYQVAESYRAAAEWPKLQLNAVVSSSVDLRENYRKERDELLEQARLAYVRLREYLSNNGEAVAVDPLKRKLLENSYFGEADLLYEMQDYEKAIGIYRSASNRFLSQPASLEALTRVAQCLQQLGRNSEAVRVINQAVDLINRIDESKPNLFENTTRGSKEEWMSYLRWLKSTMA